MLGTKENNIVESTISNPITQKKGRSPTPKL
jgi:hypothetical protein